MNIFFFHLMPYADLDMQASADYKTTWVNFPNKFYDPVKGHKLYNRYLDELEYAEELGFDGVSVNEHHQTAYGLMPVPGVMAAALARRTSRMKIAVLGRALPLVNNPLTIAEEYAMIDNITGGRLIAGFVRGIGAEYHSWGVSPATSHERFHEAHDLIVRAWQEPGPFEFSSKHYHFKYVNTWPRPFQQPRPPIWIPSQGSRETIEWAAHPDRRYAYLQTFSPVAALIRFMDMYRETARGFGYEATPSQLGWAVPTYVAKTDEIAREQAKVHIEYFFNKFLRLPNEMLLPPGYLSLSSLKAVMSAKKTMTGAEQTIDDLIEKGIFLCGSADTVAGQIEKHHATANFGNILVMLQFGTLPADLTRTNMELFAEKVMPRVRQLTA
jgi:alkanesulfonate monooxygenase SsuD/methylene tetrahydromethanopterin reductase-like flavin-dependent oxidoreductase (luciferase family)